MTIIEPHIHMLSRTTDEYQALYRAGIRACVEPSFWLGTNRRYAGSFFDYFRLILEFETVRAARFGIDHFCAIAMNPKEADDRGLADEVIDGLGEYLDHPRCVAMGEIGLNLNTPNEEHAMIRQLSVDCGYSASALRERLYAAEGTAGSTAMNAVLIYTGSPDSEGSLGGLVRLADPALIADRLPAVPPT